MLFRSVSQSRYPAQTLPALSGTGLLSTSSLVTLNNVNNPVIFKKTNGTNLEGGIIGSRAGSSILYNNATDTSGKIDPNGTLEVKFVNTPVSLTGISTGTINQLREAFQMQKFLERDARGGARYNELVYSHFGVTLPDAQKKLL